MRRRSRLSPVFQAVAMIVDPSDEKKGGRGFEFCAVCQQARDGPRRPSWSILASRRTELTRVNKRLCPQGTGWSKT